MKKNHSKVFDLAVEGKTVLALGLRTSATGMHRMIVLSKLEDFGVESARYYDDVMTEEERQEEVRINEALNQLRKDKKFLYVDCHNLNSFQLEKVVAAAMKKYEITDVVIDDYRELDKDLRTVMRLAAVITELHKANVYY